MSARLGSLWRHADFLKLWVGESISLVGSQVTLLALPLQTMRGKRCINRLLVRLRKVE